MSQQNVEFVEGLLAATGSLDKEALLAALPELIAQTCQPDIEWVEGVDRADRRVHHGHDGVLESWERWLEMWDQYGFEVEQVTDHGDHVLAVAVEHATGQASGASVSSRIYLVLTFRAGKIARYQEFYNEKPALEAAGLTREAMSHENVEIVRNFYAAVARTEFPVEVIDPEVEYVNPAGAVEPGTRRGLRAFQGAVEKVFEGWEAWEMEPERFVAKGDQVAVVVRYRARGRTSRIELEGRESALLTLRAGKLMRYEWFHDPNDALRVADAVADADAEG